MNPEQETPNSEQGLTGLNNQETNTETVPQAETTAPNPQRPIKALRTFAGDVEEALGKGKNSSATIMIAEQKRREERPDFAPRPKTPSGAKNKTFLTLGIILFLVGILGVGGVYYFKTQNGPAAEEDTKSIISFSREKNITVAADTAKNVLVTKFNTEKDQFKMPLNSLLYVRFTDSVNKEVSAENIFKILGKEIPSDLARSFDGKYMFGVYSFDQNEPFMIIKTSDYPISYSGMLRWEKGMAQDLSEIFGISSSLFGTAFVDEELKNKDLRLLRDLDNKTVLVYSFIDKNTLIIARNENVFSAILGKYIINQQVK